MAFINFNSIRDLFRSNPNRPYTYILATNDSSSFNPYNTFKDSKQNYNDLLKAFNDIGEVYAPIMFRVNNSSKVKFKVFEKRGDELIEIENINDPLIKLLNKPNDFMSWNDFKGTSELNKILFGNSYINFFKANTVNNGTIPKKMFVLPAQKMVIDIDDREDFRASSIKNYSLVYIKKGAEKKQLFDIADVLHIKNITPNVNNNIYLYGTSSLISVNPAINSISAAYSAKTKLYKDGVKYVMTAQSNQNDAYSVVDEDEVRKEQDRLKKYGMTDGQYSTIMTHLPLTVTPVSYNVAQLQITENLTSDFQAICRNVGVPSILISDNTSATFSNKEVANYQFFQGTFKSSEDAFFEDLTNHIQTYEIWKDRVILPDYSSVPELNTSLKDNQDLYIKDVEHGIITRNEYLKNTGRQYSDNPEFDQYFTYNNGQWSDLNSTQNE